MPPPHPHPLAPASPLGSASVWGRQPFRRHRRTSPASLCPFSVLNKVTRVFENQTNLSPFSIPSSCPASIILEPVSSLKVSSFSWNLQVKQNKVVLKVLTLYTSIHVVVSNPCHVCTTEVPGDNLPRSRFVGIIPSIKVFFVKYNWTIKFRQNAGSNNHGCQIPALLL